MIKKKKQQQYKLIFEILLGKNFKTSLINNKEMK